MINQAKNGIESISELNKQYTIDSLTDTIEKAIDNALDKVPKEIPKQTPPYALVVRQEAELIEIKQQSFKAESTLIVALNDGLAPFWIAGAPMEYRNEEICEIDMWPHLVGLKLADPTFDKLAPINIIFRADIAPSLYTGQVKFQNMRGPTACHSGLGWLLSGKVITQNSDNSLHHHVLTYRATSISDQLRNFWELDSIPPCFQPIFT
ncbi:hypothetical protein LAZ67_4003456 [Cordylochernes scorpioides]|uniref:Uncharacterized protein n=1 Tax=Cordylochernes scorpioides TaxID=51811 RepID=A0ABY6KFH4_9ARAC|nr:hypothetical protein LAZ67_4003456 [Cordylochernes scorpioides]